MSKKKIKKQFKLKLRGKTAVFIDWANVYNWKSSLKKEIDIKKLFDYFKSYPKIKEISFYFGTDKYPASKEQLKVARKVGYRDDFATLYKRLIKRKKQTIVVYQKGHLGREVWNLKKGILKLKLKDFLPLKKCPPTEG